MNVMNRDGLMHISLMGGQARALLIDSTQMVEEARRIHGLSRTATAALGRTLSATALMASTLKNPQESVSVTIKGGGPIGSVVTVGHGDGTVKGYVDDPLIELPRNGKKLNVGGAVGSKGKMTVVKDLGMREPYVGQTNLVSGEIAEDFAMYFTASEQTPSLVALGVLVGEKVEAAGGLIIQMLPGASEAAIASVENSAQLYRDISAQIGEFGLEGSVTQLVGHLEPEILSRSQPVYRCNCGRERIERVLITLGAEELGSMIREQHGAQVDCHFCNKRYVFTEEELKALLRSAQEKE